MKFLRLVILVLVVFASETVLAQSLREAVGKYCLVGAAVNQWQSDGQVPKADKCWLLQRASSISV